ncbi:hypothetical protein KW850_27585 [Bacillus sp. sid0103]|uniref:glycosyltransferase family protein n=1 Tax=Bacillus sp. sid0103 TaxID=2856337 RepID=UPI001C4604C0|nr:hypothetical protein [Bacillus sp. sid0103]MBV7508969.1 hypothetical protein [Bacillus sp. sid0103]
MSDYPRVLIISHNCLSTSGSNGRTLANFFDGWPIEKLAQFYIYNEIPDSSVCNNYFRVLDTEALRAFIKREKVGQKVNPNSTVVPDNKEKSMNNLYQKHRKRNSLNYIARNLIWNSKRWKSDKFTQWVDNFQPELIVLQVGDYEFMYKIALDIANGRNIPLVLYNSEDYYFKDRKYLSPLYHYYRYRYKKRFERVISYASHSIYNCDILQETYNKRFVHPSTVIMTSTDIVPLQNKKKNITPIVSYLGNLGVGRHEPLIEIANALQQINPEILLDIYGKTPNLEVKSAFEKCKGIQYRGLVPYEEVVQVMHNSDLLVHIENFSEFYKWDLKHAFSTKIADSLGSGTCLLMYGPGGLACTQYLVQTNAACVVTEQSKLKSQLAKLLADESLRNSYKSKALKIIGERHDAKSNQEKFHGLLCKIMRENKHEDSTN